MRPKQSKLEKAKVIKEYLFKKIIMINQDLVIWSILTQDDIYEYGIMRGGDLENDKILVQVENLQNQDFIDIQLIASRIQQYVFLDNLQ